MSTVSENREITPEQREAIARFLDGILTTCTSESVLRDSLSLESSSAGHFLRFDIFKSLTAEQVAEFVAIIRGGSNG